MSTPTLILVSYTWYVYDDESEKSVQYKRLIAHLTMHCQVYNHQTGFDECVCVWL